MTLLCPPWYPTILWELYAGMLVIANEATVNCGYQPVNDLSIGVAFRQIAFYRQNDKWDSANIGWKGGVKEA